MSAPSGATWRSGYATVCKTVYTSSILVVASIHLIKGLARLHQRPWQRLAAGSACGVPAIRERDQRPAFAVIVIGSARQRLTKRR